MCPKSKTIFRRRRKRKCKIGIYRSPKCLTPIRYRSGWELEVCKFLDYQSDVVSYGYECVIIPYVSNTRTGKTGKTSSYYPDFLIVYSDQSRLLVEVKREDKLNDPKVIKKAKAAEEWSRKNKVKYQFWTNKIIEAIKKINMANCPPPPAKKKPVMKKTPPQKRPKKAVN